MRIYDSEDEQRYSRQRGLIGADGQARLSGARVLIVGAGGLGCPAALYLAAAGVGTIGIIDPDRVELSNLHRQILHTRVGEEKVVSAERALQPYPVRVVPIAERLVDARHTNDFDVIIDGSDNLETRYVINDLGKPWVHGSVFRFDGLVTTFREPYCYRCLYPERPQASPSCAEAGVLGVVPGIIGVLQANEALKLLLGQGDLLEGRLLSFDALTSRFSERRFLGHDQRRHGGA